MLLAPSCQKDEEGNTITFNHPYAVRKKSGCVVLSDHQMPGRGFHYNIEIERVRGDHPETLGMNGKFLVVTQADGSTVSWNHEKVLKMLKKEHK